MMGDWSQIKLIKFSNTSKTKIAKTSKIEKIEPKIIKNIIKKKIEKIVNPHKAIDRSIRVTNKWNLNQKNKISTNNVYWEYINEDLQNLKKDVISFATEEKKKQYLLMKIGILKELLDYPQIKQDVTSDELFDHCATLIRKTYALQYYADLSFEDFKENHVEKHFNWDLISSLEIITTKLWIDINISKYNKNLNNNPEIYILEGSIDLITKYEGFAEISKWDTKHYSWWYGTKAPKWWLKISKTDARIELLKEIEKVKNFIEKEYPQLKNNQKISLISFFYNNWLWKKWKENLIYRLENLGKHIEWIGVIWPNAVTNIMKQYVISWWKKLKGLERRRNEESKIFLANNTK